MYNVILLFCTQGAVPFLRCGGHAPMVSIYLSAWRQRTDSRFFRVCESIMQISCRSPITKLKNASAVRERHKPFFYIYIFTPSGRGPERTERVVLEFRA